VGPTVVNIAGASRIGTAVEASKLAFPAGSEYVVIATARNWPDALGGSALAGALDAPILLTEPTWLPPAVSDEITRLNATHAIILGGTGAVSDAVSREIAALPGMTVERIAGASRYATANLVAARTIGELGDAYDGTAFVATGANFPDALGASPIAAANGWPIYLANPSQGANDAMVSSMRSAGVTEAVILGGTGAVSLPVESDLWTLGTVTRLAGTSRYDTAVKVASYGVSYGGLGYDRVAIATGENFPDALAGGVLQGKSGSVLLLTPTASLNPAVAALLTAEKQNIHEVRFLGGTGAVFQVVRDRVSGILQ
jgi:putative cell wall-binding protein